MPDDKTASPPPEPTPESPWDTHATALVEALEGLLGVRLADRGALPYAMDYLTKRAAARDPALVPGIEKLLDALEAMGDLLVERPEVKAVRERLAELQAVMKGTSAMSGDTRAWIDQIVVALFLVLSQAEAADASGSAPAPEPVPEKVYTLEDLLPAELLVDPTMPLEPDLPEGPLVDPTIAARTIEDLRRSLGLDPTTGLAIEAPTTALDDALDVPPPDEPEPDPLEPDA